MTRMHPTPHRLIPPALLPILGFVAALVAAPAARSTEWSITPAVSLQELYNDNILLTPVPGPAVTGTILSPSVDVSAQQEAWNLSGTAQWQSTRYGGHSDLNTNNQYLNLQSNYQTLRSTWALTGTYAKESVLTGTSYVADVGLVHTQVERITRTLSPTWTWIVTPNVNLQLSYQYDGAGYLKAATAGLFNYSQNAVNVQLSDQVTPRNQIIGSVGYSYFKVPVLQFAQEYDKSNTSTAMIGLNHQFSNTLTGSLSVGAQGTRSAERQCNPFILAYFGQCYAETAFSKNSGTIYNATLTKQFERNTVNLAFGRSISPSGAGTQVLIDSSTLGDNWQISPRLLGLASVNAYRIRAVGTSVTELNRDYYGASTELRWEWTRNLKVSAQYQYIWVKYDSGGPGSNNMIPAKSSSVYLTLKYSWPYLTLSR